MVTFKPPLFCTHATSHKADWILTTSSSALSCPSVSSRVQSHEGSSSWTSGVSLSREFFCDHIAGWCTHSIYLLVYICVMCIVYTLPLDVFAFIAFSLSISLFSYHVKWYFVISLSVTIFKMEFYTHLCFYIYNH